MEVELHTEQAPTEPAARIARRLRWAADIHALAVAGQSEAVARGALHVLEYSRNVEELSTRLRDRVKLLRKEPVCYDAEVALPSVVSGLATREVVHGLVLGALRAAGVDQRTRTLCLQELGVAATHEERFEVAAQWVALSRRSE